MVLLLEASVDLSILWTALLSIAGVVVLVALAVFIFKLVGLIGSLTRVINGLEPRIYKVVDELPPIVQNVSTISSNVVDMTDDVATELPKVLSNVTTLSTAATEVTDSVTGLVGEVGDGLTDLVSHLRHPFKTGGTVIKVLKGARQVQKTLKRSTARKARRRR